MVAEIVLYSLFLLVSLAAFLIGVTDNFFGFLPDPLQATLASFFSGLLVFLAGDRITAGVRERAHKESSRVSLARAFAGIPQINCIMEFPSCDDGMRYLATRVSFAKVILNTKVSQAGVEPRSDVGADFRKAIEKGLKRGLVVKDIVSKEFAGAAEKLKAESESWKGSYSFHTINSPPSCFLNFIVLNYESGDSEMVVGWATSSYMGTEQKAYGILDKRVIAYFETFHSALFRDG